MTTKALVVDNNPVLLRALCSFLEREGCEVRAATNGLEALHLLKHYLPDIVFTDLVMPLIGGEQLCKIIRGNKRMRHVYLVIVSGIVLEDFENLISEKYYDLCIAKGNLGELQAYVRDALQRLSERSAGKENRLAQPSTHIPDGLSPSPVAVELLSEKRHLSRILENLDEGIIEFDSGGMVISLNRAAQKILGLREEVLLGSSLGEYPWGEWRQRIQGWLNSRLSEGAAEQLEILENAPLFINDKIVTASFMPVHDGKAGFGLCILRDITRQSLAEEHERKLSDAIKLVTKMEAMSCMAGGIAHDFNNLLTVICGNLDILLHVAAKEMSAEKADLLEHAHSAAYMAVDLTRKISSSSPFGIISRQSCLVDEIVARTVRQFALEQEVVIETCYGARGAMVSVNPEQIGVALANILRNAVEAGGGKSLKVATRAVEFTGVTIISGQYVPAGVYACLEVRDNGHGIARENLLKIFDPYYSTKARGVSKGVGLGLTVVYATMRNHGGYVVVDSVAGQGTSVCCYLPRYRRTADGEGETCRVLLVDTDDQSREVGRIMLEHLGCEVLTAETLGDAVDMLEQQALLSGKPLRLVMIDPSQAGPDEREEICSRLKSPNCGLKVVATGGALLDPLMHDFGRFGYSTVLPKPFTMDGLRHILSMTLRM